MLCYCRATAAALAAFIEVMQKIADVATGAKGDFHWAERERDMYKLHRSCPWVGSTHRSSRMCPYSK